MSVAEPIPSQGLLFSTVGVGYLGVVFSSTLYGVTCVQSFWYFRGRQTDLRFIPPLVVALWILDTIHQALINHALYYYLIVQYGKSSALEFMVWSIPAGILVSAFVALIVEGFLLWRIWQVSNNVPLTGLCGTLVVAHFGINLSTAIRFFFKRGSAAALKLVEPQATAGLALDSLLNIILSVALVGYLYKGKTGFRKSDDVIGRLIVMTISSGSLTTFFVISEMIAYILAPRSLYIIFFNFIVGKLYVNTCLTSLNTRNYLKERLHGAHSNSLPLGFRREPAFAPEVTVETVIQVMEDTGVRTSFDEENPSPDQSTTKAVLDVEIPKSQPVFTRDFAA